jgi:hypothetical protein
VRPPREFALLGLVRMMQFHAGHGLCDYCDDPLRENIRQAWADRGVHAADVMSGRVAEPNVDVRALFALREEALRLAAEQTDDTALASFARETLRQAGL